MAEPSTVTDVALVGVGRPIRSTIEAGDLVVASVVRTTAGADTRPAAHLVAGALRRRGLRVHVGPIVSRDGNDATQSSDAAAIDDDGLWPSANGAQRPLTLVLAAGEHGTASTRAVRRTAQPVLEELAKAMRPYTVVLAAPRASCAGVERAIEVVELTLARFGPPVYVRRQIVHNAHVVADLERRGVIFVDEVEAVPRGATVILSAHGVAPDVRAAARARALRVIDATCPLVNKVHAEARRFAASGRTIVLIGHDGHEEVIGTRGEAPNSIRVVATAEDVDSLAVEDPDQVAYLTQTTLAVDDTEEVVQALRDRFPMLVGPGASDICYATQNRQDAVKALAASCDLVLVIGSSNSSNSRRLVEVAERHGTPARLIEDDSVIEPGWLERAETIGVTAGASTPEALVQQVVAAIAALGPTEVQELATTTERVRFSPPPIG